METHIVTNGYGARTKHINYAVLPVCNKYHNAAGDNSSTAKHS